MFGRKSSDSQDSQNSRTPTSEEPANVETNPLHYANTSDECDHTWNLSNHLNEMLRCNGCGIPTYNLAYLAATKSYASLKWGIPVSVQNTAGALAYAATDFLDAFEPFIDALTQMEVKDSKASYEVAEQTVRSILKSVCALTLINGMYLANGSNNWVAEQTIDNIVGAQLHDKLLQYGNSYSLIDHLGWPANNGVCAPMVNLNGHLAMTRMIQWIEGLGFAQYIPIRAALRKSWFELYDFAATQQNLGCTGARKSERDACEEMLAPKQYDMPLSTGKERLVPKRESAIKLRDLVINFVPEAYQAPALLVAYRSLHESKCNQGRRMEDDEEIDLTELLLAPALRNPEGFQYINPEMDPFKSSGESVLKPRQDYEIVHRVMHRLPLAPIYFLDMWGQDRMQFMYDWTRAVAEYQVADGYPSLLEQQVQMEIASSWEDSNWNLYLGSPSSEESED
jgi:hypothetical protein